VVLFQLLFVIVADVFTKLLALTSSASLMVWDLMVWLKWLAYSMSMIHCCLVRLIWGNWEFQIFCSIELASGLKINLFKSSVILLADNQALQVQVVAMLNCQVGTFPITYLGIPLRPGKFLHVDWQPLLDKTDKRLAGWKGVSLSRGRLVLVNVVLTAMPLYMMSFTLSLSGY